MCTAASFGLSSSKKEAYGIRRLLLPIVAALVALALAAPAQALAPGGRHRNRLAPAVSRSTCITCGFAQHLHPLDRNGHPEVAAHLCRRGKQRGCEHHTRRSAITKFDLCVANRENGEPGALTYNTIHWFAVNDYYGAYSFLHPTWVTAGGLRFAYNANLASPEQQSIVFNSYSARDPGAWPNTLPPCLYLR